MWAAILLGFTGSLGHCIGMCSGVSLLLSRRGQARGWRVLFLHLGRITTYSLLGAVAGGIGYSLITALSICFAPLAGGRTGGGSGLPGVVWLQGALALLTAVLAIYMSLSLIG
ncbi:MAG TPA: sulfite exporter TauE/SafE family protein, partial [Chloroflexi bacterium]|nr:sulfite exporter TauE/SafE family protein [Chloroflexota bacterium]